MVAAIIVELVCHVLDNRPHRLSINLYGAPALTLGEFRTYRQDLIIGTSLQVSTPVGQYDASRVVNLRTNRWSFRPELGISKALGHLTLELAAGATFYAANTNFFGGMSVRRTRFYGVQGHAICNFRSGLWVSADVTYFTGGRTAIDGERGNDLLRNWRVGATLSVPLNANHSVRIYGSGGVSTRTDGAALQYRWGGGL